MRHKFAWAFLFLLLSAAAAATVPAADDEFWASFWAQPKIILNGAEEEAFYQGMKDVVFALNEYDKCQNPAALEEDARWLKEHPNVQFYIDGYASKRGNRDYNLLISQRRADWVKGELTRRGVAEGQVKLSVGWGELYPNCLGMSDECLAKNKLVRFTYVRGS